MTRLSPINPAIGDRILDMIKDQTGKSANIILIAFPIGDDPQPEFITSYSPEIMESVIKQLANQMTSTLLSSRRIDKRNFGE